MCRRGDGRRDRIMNWTTAGLVSWLVVCVGGGALVGMVTAGGDSAWYQALVKPTWTPPGWIFGPVWTLLYAAMALAAWRVWRRGGWTARAIPLSRGHRVSGHPRESGIALRQCVQTPADLVARNGSVHDIVAESEHVIEFRLREAADRNDGQVRPRCDARPRGEKDPHLRNVGYSLPQLGDGSLVERFRIVDHQKRRLVGLEPCTDDTIPQVRNTFGP